MSRRPVLILVIVALLLVAAGGGYLLRDRIGRSSTVVPSTPPAAAGVAPAGAPQHRFLAVAPHVRPAVVHLGTIQRAKSRRGPNLPQGNDDPFFRDFFNQFFGSVGPDSPSEFRRPRPGPRATIA